MNKSAASPCFPRLPPSPAAARAAICSRGWPWGGNCAAAAAPSPCWFLPRKLTARPPPPPGRIGSGAAARRGAGPGQRAGLFLWRFWQSYRMSIKCFLKRPPATGPGHGRIHRRSAGSRRQTPRRPHLPARIQLHSRTRQSLARPGGGWGVFVYFAAAGDRLRARRVEVTGMPVRGGIFALDRRRQWRERRWG